MLVFPQKFLALADKQGKPIKGKPVKFVREGQMCFARLTVPRAICVETFKDFDQFGRFMLRDEGTCCLSPPHLCMRILVRWFGICLRLTQATMHRRQDPRHGYHQTAGSTKQKVSQECLCRTESTG